MAKCCPLDGTRVVFRGVDDGYGEFGDELREEWDCEECGSIWLTDDLDDCLIDDVGTTMSSSPPDSLADELQFAR